MSVLECPQAPVKGRCWPPAHSFLGMVLQRPLGSWKPEWQPFLQAWGARSAAPQALTKLGPWGDRKTGLGGQRANRDKP